MHTPLLEEIATMKPDAFREEHRAMLDELAGTMPTEAETLLAAAGTAEIDALVERFNAAFRVIKQLNVSQGITQKDLHRHLGSLQEVYGALKAAVRQQHAIGREDPRYGHTRNIADACATLHARVLAALGKGFRIASASDTADDLSLELGEGMTLDDAPTATRQATPTA